MVFFVYTCTVHCFVLKHYAIDSKLPNSENNAFWLILVKIDRGFYEENFQSGCF